jgi:hypothetical protein
MKSKLEATIGELHRLKNQIRVELNQIRPRQQPAFPEKREKSSKRLFQERCH